MDTIRQQKTRPDLFITGTSGFVGTRLLAHIDSADFSQIILLNRHKILLPDHLASANTVRQISGTLHDSARYSEHLGPDTRIIHLAGITGKADRDAYFETNARGTEQLIQAARRAGIHAFLFISSIAVAFKNRKGYYYAESKQLAEQKLQSSGLRYVIVRPTMILGTSSPVLKNLTSLAKGPVILQPGNGKVPIQPIDVDDLAEFLLTIIKQDAFMDNILEAGGPEIISIGDILRKIHFAYHGKRGIVIPLPLGPIIFSLRILEKSIGKYLPVTSGQFASFCNPGTIQAGAGFEKYFGKMKSIDAMLSNPGTDLVEVPTDELAAECSVYSRYLIGREPDPYILKKYAEAFESGRPLASRIGTRFDRLIEKISTKNPIYTRAVDGYCKFFYRDSRVRKKLVLLLAILECESEAAQIIDRPDLSNPPVILLTFLTQITRSIVLLIVATILLSPIQLLSKGLEHPHRPLHG